MVLYYFLRWTVLIAVGLLVYGQTFHYDFIFDDHLFIVENPLIKNFNNIPVMWQSFPMTRLVGMYSFALNYYFGQLNPLGYHVFNFMVHLACTGLVWALAGLLLKNELAFFVALLFLVHPGQTQAVTYITQRFESLATLFYVATVYFYLRGRMAAGKRKMAGFFVLAVIAAIGGVFTKEVIMTLPVMIAACEWILFPQTNRKKIYIILAATGIVVYAAFSHMLHTGLTSFFHPFASESHDGDTLTVTTYLLTQLRVFLTFLRLLVLPLGQNLDYDYPMSTGLFSPPMTFLGLCVIAGIIFLIIRLRRPMPVTALGLAWMLITFSINLAPRTNVIFEHKLYLISFGAILAFVSALSLFVTNRRVCLSLLTVIAVVLSVISFERNKVWASELTVWQDVARKSPHKARVNASLGRIYGSLGQYDKAIDYLSRALAISPNNITYENRGIVYGLEGREPQALADLDTSISLDPKYFPVYVKRAWIYQNQREYVAARADLDQAIRLNPYYVDAYLARGILGLQTYQPQQAEVDFRKVLQLDPFNPQAKYYLAKMGAA
jgi:tetratricopeptide (TPR) repeat protein